LSQSTSPLIAKVVVVVSPDAGFELSEVPPVVCVVKVPRSEFETTKEPIAISAKKAATASPIFFALKPVTFDLPLEEVFVGRCDGRSALVTCIDLLSRASAGRAGGSGVFGETDPG
jgi:hypothetical protein